MFGEGPADADVVFVGEQPGDREDRAGRPFVGPAGRLFDKALAEAGIDRLPTTAKERDAVGLGGASGWEVAAREEDRTGPGPLNGDPQNIRWSR